MKLKVNQTRFRQLAQTAIYALCISLSTASYANCTVEQSKPFFDKLLELLSGPSSNDNCPSDLSLELISKADEVYYDGNQDDSEFRLTTSAGVYLPSSEESHAADTKYYPNEITIERHAVNFTTKTERPKKSPPISSLPGYTSLQSE